MVDVKTSCGAQVTGGPQISNITQTLSLEAYKYFDIVLSKDQKEETVTLNYVKKLSLILVKATPKLAVDSKIQLKYKIGDITKDYVPMDAPLLLFGSWISALVADELKIYIKLSSIDGDCKDLVINDKDTIKVEILTGWNDAE